MATPVTPSASAKSLAVTTLYVSKTLPISSIIFLCLAHMLLNYSLYSSGKYSDLVIKCKDKTFNVHRNVVCLQSKPIARMVDGGFEVISNSLLVWQTPRFNNISQEGISGVAKFPENDPIVMEKMIQYMYLGDYSDGRGNSSAAVAVAESSSGSARSRKETKRVEELGRKVETDDGPDYITKWPADWLGAPFLNAQVYAIAEQYDIPSLKQLAKSKYAEVVITEWNSASFVASLQLMYELTPESDRLLKEVALKTAGEHSKELVDRGEFVQLCKDHGEIAVDVLKASLIEGAKDTACPSCHRTDYVSPKGNVRGLQYYCTNCRRHFLH